MREPRSVRRPLATPWLRARVDGEAEARPDEQPAAEPPAEARPRRNGCRRRSPPRRRRRARARRCAERADPAAAPAELEVGAVLEPAFGQRRIDVVGEQRRRKSPMRPAGRGGGAAERRRAGARISRRPARPRIASIGRDQHQHVQGEIVADDDQGQQLEAERERDRRPDRQPPGDAEAEDHPEDVGDRVDHAVAGIAQAIVASR